MKICVTTSINADEYRSETYITFHNSFKQTNEHNIIIDNDISIFFNDYIYRIDKL
jgi:hypothetical protein